MAILTIVLGLLYVPIPPNPDHELYDYMAWAALNGGALYRDAGDVNMPGEPLLHMASMTLFGPNYWSYRLLDYLLLIGFCSAVALLVLRDYGRLFAGLFFLLYPVVYTTAGYWTTGQRDVLASHAITLAGFAYLRRLAGAGGPAWAAGSGVLMAAAALLKPTFLAFGPLLIALDLIIRRRPWAMARDQAILAISAAAGMGVVVLAGWRADALDSWYEMTFAFSRDNYVGGRSNAQVLGNIARTVARNWHWYTIMAASGAICWLFERRRGGLWVLAIVSTTIVVSTLVQHKGFGYHFSGLLIVTAMLSAFYLAEVIRLSRRIPDPRLRWSVLSFPVLIVLAGLLSKADRELRPQLDWYLGRSSTATMLAHREFDDVVATADYVRRSTTPGQTVWSYTLHVMINSLAARPMPTRFSHVSLMRFRDGSRLGGPWSEEVRTIFRDRPPELIVLESWPGAPEGRYRYFDAIRPEEPLGVLKEALDLHYVFERQIGRFACFRLADHPEPSAPTVSTRPPA